MNPDTVATNLKTALSGIGGTIVEYVPDRVQPPAIILAMGSGTYQTDFDDSMTAEWVAHLIVSRSDDRNAQKRLREHCAPTGTKSVRAAIEADRTLGGAVGDAAVVEWDVPSEIEIAGTTYVSVGFSIEVQD